MKKPCRLSANKQKIFWGRNPDAVSLRPDAAKGGRVF